MVSDVLVLGRHLVIFKERSDILNVEIWTNIDEFPNYKISSLGRVKNIKTNHVLKPYTNRPDGYNQVGLRNHTGLHTKKIHRLVAEAFYDCDSDNFEVNHIDGDKKNNFVGNLEWCTRSENMSHGYRLGLIAMSPNAGMPRKQIRISETGEVFESIHACARHINGRSTNIMSCLSGRQKTHRDFHFEEVIFK